MASVNTITFTVTPRPEARMIITGSARCFSSGDKTESTSRSGLGTALSKLLP